MNWTRQKKSFCLLKNLNFISYALNIFSYTIIRNFPLTPKEFRIERTNCNSLEKRLFKLSRYLWQRAKANASSRIGPSLRLLTKFTKTALWLTLRSVFFLNRPRSEVVVHKRVTQLGLLKTPSRVWVKSCGWENSIRDEQMTNEYFSTVSWLDEFLIASWLLKSTAWKRILSRVLSPSAPWARDIFLISTQLALKFFLFKFFTYEGKTEGHRYVYES